LDVNDIPKMIAALTAAYHYLTRSTAEQATPSIEDV